MVRYIISNTGKVSFLVNFQDNIYSVITSLYTKYSTQDSYLRIEAVNKLFWVWIVLGYKSGDL